MAAIHLRDIRKTYPNGHVAVHQLSLDIADGEFLVLVGPSGCGKSTTLRLVAGLEMPTSGQLHIGDRDVTFVPPQERDLAMVFQNYALYPHKTVRQNLEFGLRMRHTPSSVITERVQRVARILDINQVLERKPGQLSGGQRQRVALGRAIVREPRAFLLDEPLSNLDAQLRVRTRAELARMHRQLGATMLYVTHDQEEALTLGDRVAVLRDGWLQQVAPPMTIYRQPANVFVAGFIGAPTMNFLPCQLRDAQGTRRIEGPLFTQALDCPSLTKEPSNGLLLGIRPQDIRLVPAPEADAIAQVDVVQPLGSDMVVYLNLTRGADYTPMTVVVPSDTPLQVNQEVGIRLERDRLHLFDAASETRLNG
ncbi:MAG: ABC transporter ATP-binding protein [Gemmataceae bacterium]